MSYFSRPAVSPLSAVTVVKRETSALLVFCIDAVWPELGSVRFFPACEMGFTRPLTRIKLTE